MRGMNRRSLIIGAGMAAATPKLVLAESLVDIPQSILDARRWAVEEFNEMPSCRLVFSDGTAYKWFKYQTVQRYNAYAVAIEVAVTDAAGRRAVSTIPVDGYGLHRTVAERTARRNAELARKRNDWLAMMNSI